MSNIKLSKQELQNKLRQEIVETYKKENPNTPFTDDEIMRNYENQKLRDVYNEGGGRRYKPNYKKTLKRFRKLRKNRKSTINQKRTRKHLRKHKRTLRYKKT